MKKFVILATLLLSTSCFTDADATRSTLQKAGFTDIETGGYDWWACGEDDTYHTRFTATNPNGQRVTGVVCCGMWAKACTVRF